MRSTSRFLAVFLAALMMCSTLAGCGGNSGGSTAPAAPAASTDSGSSSDTSSSESSGGSQEAGGTYKLACIAPFTGNSSQYGESYKSAIEFMLERINGAGGVNGKQIVVEYFDDKNDAKETVSCAQLVTSDPEVIACIGPFSSTCAIAAGPTFQKAGIPLMAPNCSHDDFTKLGEYMIRGTNVQAFNNKFVADYLYNKLGARTLSIIYVNDDAGNGVNEMLTENFEGHGGKVLDRETYALNAKDFSAILAKIKQNTPDVLSVYGGYADCATIKSQLDTLDIDCQVLMYGQCVKDEFLDLLGTKADGILFLAPFDPNKKNEKFQEFKAEFLEYSGFGTIDSSAYHTAELVNLLKVALETCGEDRAAIAAFLRNQTDFEGLSDPITIVEGDFQRNLNPITVENGEFVSLAQ